MAALSCLSAEAISAWLCMKSGAYQEARLTTPPSHPPTPAPLASPCTYCARTTQ